MAAGWPSFSSTATRPCTLAPRRGRGSVAIGIGRLERCRSQRTHPHTNQGGSSETSNFLCLLRVSQR